MLKSISTILHCCDKAVTFIVTNKELYNFSRRPHNLMHLVSLLYAAIIKRDAYYRPNIDTTASIWQPIVTTPQKREFNVTYANIQSKSYGLYLPLTRSTVDLHPVLAHEQERAQVAKRWGSKVNTMNFERHRHHLRRANRFTVSSSTTPTLAQSAALDQDGRDISYFSTIRIGSNNKAFRCVMDTGSSDLWVPASDCADAACRTSPLHKTNVVNHETLGATDSSTLRTSTAAWTITYGSGAVKGKLVQDTISIAGMKTSSIAFGTASTLSTSFQNFPADGILGLGSASSSAQKVPTFMDNLVTSGMLTRKLVAFNIHRAKDNDNDGQVSFGVVDTTKFSGALISVKNVAKGGLWEAAIEGITVAGTAITIGTISGIIDTGTTLLIAPPALATAIHTPLTGAQSDGQGSFSIPCSTTAQISLTFGGRPFFIDPRDYVGSVISGNNCLSRITGQDIGGKLLIGDVFLKNTYTVFDFDNNEIGFGAKGLMLKG